MKLTHINENNNPTMVDISTKDISSRIAVASGEISVSKEAFEMIEEKKKLFKECQSTINSILSI